MTNELFLFIVILFIGLFFCFYKLNNDRVYFGFTLTLFVVFSIVTRFSGFDIDMHTYANALQYSSMSVYYLKEPVYWLSSRYVYSVLDSPELTFLFFDFLSILIILKSSKKLDLPQYFPYLFLLFFPTVMGFNNIFRQFLSSVILLYSWSIILSEGRTKKTFIVFLMSGFTHNAAFLFAPLITVFKGSLKSNLIKFFAFSFGILLALPWAINTKSFSDTGSVPVEAFIMVVFLFYLLQLLTNRFLLIGFQARFFAFLNYLLFLLILSSITMGSAQSKRIGMFVLVLILVPSVRLIEDKFKHKTLVRVIFYIVIVMPTLLFSSSRSFLLT
ncbi:EpsG family protein [Salinivibrio kushneri]|uniref:EpsG family protein n=1 Tax=Salinivibrio kushneri TaxID=1908198 RepID=UPI0038CDACFA